MIVLDASAVIDVVLDRPPKAWVLGRIEGADIVAPAHQPAEVLSAVARLVRSGDVDDVVAAEALTDAAALRQELVAPTAGALQRALELQHRLRVLDGLYVVLADERGATLVTTDERLARSGVGRDVASPATGGSCRCPGAARTGRAPTAVHGDDG